MVINNLEKFAYDSALSSMRVPENTLPNTLNPPKKTNKPNKAPMCIKSFSFAGIKKDKSPKIEIGAPNIAGI